MSRLHSLLISSFLVGGFLILNPGSALALSPSDEACVERGGTPTHESPLKGCDEPAVNVGNAPEHSSAQQTDVDTSFSGNDGNKLKLDCSGPPGQQDPRCP